MSSEEGIRLSKIFAMRNMQDLLVLQNVMRYQFKYA